MLNEDLPSICKIEISKRKVFRLRVLFYSLRTDRTIAHNCDFSLFRCHFLYFERLLHQTTYRRHSGILTKLAVLPVFRTNFFSILTSFHYCYSVPTTVYYVLFISSRILFRLSANVLGYVWIRANI